MLTRGLETPMILPWDQVLSNLFLRVQFFLAFVWSFGLDPGALEIRCECECALRCLFPCEDVIKKLPFLFMLGILSTTILNATREQCAAKLSRAH